MNLAKIEPTGNEAPSATGKRPESHEALVLTIRDDRNGSQSIPARRYSSLLDVALENETSLTFQCCRAACGACLIRVVSHPENLSEVEEAERRLLTILKADPDQRLACQCSLLGEVEIEPCG